MRLLALRSGLHYRHHMATVFLKATSKYWYAQFYDPVTGKRVCRSTGKEKRREAEKTAEDMESAERKRAAGDGLSKPLSVLLETAAREASAGALTTAKAEELLTRIRKIADPEFKVVSFSDHFTAWVKDQGAHVGLSTIATYNLALKRIVAALGKRAAGMPVGEISEGLLKQALHKVKAAGLRASSVNMDLRVIRRSLHKAVSEGLASVNAASGIRPFPETDSIEKVPFTAEEVGVLIGSSPTDEWKGVILIAPQTGLRLGDVVKLSRHHIEGARIVIRPGKTSRKKKVLSIPLTPLCIEWIGNRQGEFFPTLSKMKTATLSTTFARIMKRAGIPKEVVMPGGVVGQRTFHSLRHTFSSWLAEANVHPDVRRKLTGHASSAIHDRYSHHDEALDRAISALPSLELATEAQGKNGGGDSKR